VDENPPFQVKITDPHAPPTSGWAGLGAYVALTKPRIIELLLITTVPAMVLAEGGWPGTWLVIATLIGGTLSAGGANAINNFFDRDIDVVMRRTSRRPLPRDAIPPLNALWFGVILGVVGFVWLWLFANLPAGLLATGALLFYVFVYTMGLKRSTPQNIVIGGAAGAAPVLVGWAAVTGGLAPAAWILFGIVFCWTPPHFWALAMRYKDDYANAGVPMLPVVIGEQRTTWHILGYSLLLTAVSLLLWPVAPTGMLYPIAALILGLYFIVEAVRLIRQPDRSMELFRYSTIYLAVLFAMIWVDTAIS
jgi:protoheme IX farnesyltransferase